MRWPTSRHFRMVLVALCAVLAGGAIQRAQDSCGPFTDVSPAFCPYILEVYYLGITAGTSATTFSPDQPLTRGQAAVFTSKGVNQAISRSSRRAALGQWWMTNIFAWSGGIGTTPLPTSGPFGAMACDGTDVWVGGYDSVFRVRASDGRLLETWTIAQAPTSILAAMGRVFLTGFELPPGGGGPGGLFMIDPAQPPGAAVKVFDFTSSPYGLAFDGYSVWSAQLDRVSISSPSSTLPWPTQTTAKGGFQTLTGIVFDGQNVWVTDTGACALLKLDANGSVTQTVSLGAANCGLKSPTFDGTNLLVPTQGAGLLVVRASDGTLITTLAVSGGVPDRAIFDGERILVVSDGAGQMTPPSLTLLRAADFSILQQQVSAPIGGPNFEGGATDGLNFFVLTGTGNGPVLGRY